MADSPLPPGYPRDLERTVTLQDGRAVFLRPIVPGDAPALAEALRAADAATLRRRFLGSPPPVTDRLLRHLTAVDLRATARPRRLRSRHGTRGRGGPLRAGGRADGGGRRRRGAHAARQIERPSIR
ncbi:hypothetical protein [Nonomuraea harbinensis]|uniref:N-acetyltransferase n=1 Tax=Nonomuraea harbinensis TaxID=1286938 RepID=A0ABW1C1L9_9ACTN|nr:hypothetical protein [Nonomuraea harbinensis]